MDKIDKISKVDKTGKTDKIDEMNKIGKTDKINEMNKIDKTDETGKMDKVDRIDKNDKNDKNDKIDKMDLWKKAVSLRRQLGEDATSPIDIFTLAFSIAYLTIVYYPMGEHLSGMCIKDAKNCVIAINSSMTLGRQRFSMAHEFYHLFYDEESLTAVCAKAIGEGKEKEQEADQFASYFLMPPDALSGLIEQIRGDKREGLSLKDIVRIEQHFQISRQAVLHRLLEEGELTQQEADSMRQNVTLSAVNLGYQDSLYKPMPKEKQYGTYGYYIQQADRAMELGLISYGKYEELLLAAFRDDLVYGEELEGGEVLD